MEEKKLRHILSSNIKKGRMKENLSQIALAEKMKISANFLSNIECGKTWISPGTVVKLATALNIEPYELFKDNQVIHENKKDTIQAYAEENIQAVLHLMEKLNN